ncbi:MAG TPA: DUF6265 family protein [Pyrinomonadaceae bacterium]|jgi:hypothetical protein
MYRRSPLLTILAMLLLATASGSLAQKPAQKSPTLADLAWLTGCWEGRQGDAIIEEVWSKSAGGTMLGFGRTVKRGKTTTFEFMQIRETNRSLTYMPQPEGGTRFNFPLKDSFAGKMTFENPEHDFPQRVIYQPQGRLLLAAIEGTYKGKAERQEFLMRRVRCNN